MKLANLILFIAIASNSFAQDFEGKVIYSNIYTSKVPNIPNEQFNAMMGSTQEYMIKEGNYKSTMNGTFVQWQLYINKDNKLYNKIASSTTILWNDGAISTDEVLKAEVNRNVTEVLGRQCDELILTCKSGVQKYYYSTDLKVDPKLFENHKFGNWNEIMARTNSLPLRIVMETQQFGLECNAVEIQPMKLDSKLFELPVGSKLEKSPY
ncbi:MAG: hypothetical protein ABL895_21600 [Cyclobacteriaceae bacterium]